MTHMFERTEMLLGEEAMKKLAGSRVAVFGLGGVGGHAMEALARSGVGALDLIDNDVVDITNLNRQIIATRKTLGMDKTEAAKDRIESIAPDCRITVRREFFLPETKDRFDFAEYDYVIDAIDTVAGKLALIEASKEAEVPIICSMGAGNKLDASAFKVADIYETSVCPLAKVIRRECRKRGIKSLKVVYSEEEPRAPGQPAGRGESQSEQPAGRSESQSEQPAGQGEGPSEQPAGRKRAPGSVAFAPAVAGLIIAGEVIRDICGV